MSAPEDVCLHGGWIYDGNGGAPYVGDVVLRGGRIAELGPAPAKAAVTYDVSGLAVAPGFINLLSWANESLLIDGLAESDLRQGITLEVMGEGWSMGPYSAATAAQARAAQGDIRYDIDWTTLDGYLRRLERQGVAVNVASFVGATTVREYVLGSRDASPTPEELAAMCALVESAMREGALGLASAIPYAPASFATPEELSTLAAAAGRLGGIYATHIRSESHTALSALDEALAVARDNRMPVHIYHLKRAGRARDGFTPMLEKIEAARAEGLQISADTYCYPSAWAALSICLPPWALAGGLEAFIDRMRDDACRARVAAEIASDQTEWENYYQLAGAEATLLLGFATEALKPLTGRTLAEVSRQRGTPPEQTILDLVISDRSPVLAAFTLTGEDQVRRKMQIPWIGFGSDAAAPAASGVFLKSQPHPRAYANVARLLGHYVREENLLTLAEAVRRLTGLAADILRLNDRGRLRPGAWADVAVFDPDAVAAQASFADPHRYATGMRQVWVNGVQVLADGVPTGLTGGRVVRGRGYAGRDA